jgi:dethiobiotin synthetase
MGHTILVLGIHTDAGKTMVSGILTAGLRATYWKPVQTGSPTDADTLRNWGIPSEQIAPHVYHLPDPESPHSAAQKAGVQISIQQIVAQKPVTEGWLLIEGAGGVHTPLSYSETFLDLAQALQPDYLVIVVDTYLGAINHAVLTARALRILPSTTQQGIIMNGYDSFNTEPVITSLTGLPVWARIPRFNSREQIDLASFYERYCQLPFAPGIR